LTGLTGLPLDEPQASIYNDIKKTQYTITKSKVKLSSYLSKEVHALDDLTENDVLSIQPRCLGSAEEKLAAIGVGSSIGHRQDA